MVYRNVIFTLVVQSLGDAAVVRDFGSVEFSGPSVGEEKPEETTSRLRQEASPGEAKAVSRNHADSHWGERAAGLSYVVLREAFTDPFALCCLLLIACYLVLQKTMTPAKAPKMNYSSNLLKPPVRDEENLSTTSSRRSRPSRGPDRFALVVNQKLTKLMTVDEVLDYALASAETGRTDIVNCVTAIHRSAKLVAGQAPLQRIRVGQDPRMRQLLDQLQTFLEASDNTAAILSRAVGNTSWALAKLQFRQDPQNPHVILETLQNVFVKHVHSFKPEEMMNTVWAFAELRRDKESKQSEQRALAVAQAACTCTDKFNEFSLQQVVYFAWALARLSSITSVKNDSSEVRAGLLNFMTKIIERCRPSITHLNTKNLAMLSWAVASMHVNMGLLDQEGTAGVLLQDIGMLIETMSMRDFLPGELASILWAVNKVHVSLPNFYKKMREHLMSQGLKGYNSQDIATIMCAFVKTGFGDDELYKMLAETAGAMVKDFNRSEKMMLRWAFGQLPQIEEPKGI